MTCYNNNFQFNLMIMMTMQLYISITYSLGSKFYIFDHLILTNPQLIIK